MAKNTLFYDDQCPICSAEIARLKTLQDGDLAFIPISQVDADKQDTLLKELHLHTADGHWITGLEANVIAWSHTRYKPFAQILLWPGLRWLAALGYQTWLAVYRFRRRLRRASLKNPS